jgi:hypothetical protein
MALSLVKVMTVRCTASTNGISGTLVVDMHLIATLMKDILLVE